MPLGFSHSIFAIALILEALRSSGQICEQSSSKSSNTLHVQYGSEQWSTKSEWNDLLCTIVASWKESGGTHVEAKRVKKVPRSQSSSVSAISARFVLIRLQAEDCTNLARWLGSVAYNFRSTFYSLICAVTCFNFQALTHYVHRRRCRRIQMLLRSPYLWQYSDPKCCHGQGKVWCFSHHSEAGVVALVYIFPEQVACGIQTLASGDACACPPQMRVSIVFETAPPMNLPRGLWERREINIYY